MIHTLYSQTVPISRECGESQQRTWMVFPMDHLLRLQCSLQRHLRPLQVPYQPGHPPQLGLGNGSANMAGTIDIEVDLHRLLQQLSCLGQLSKVTVRRPKDTQRYGNT